MLIEKIRSLPKNSGIYQYFDKDGRLLYIGKAKVLKNRVKSYFRFEPTLMPAPNLSSRVFKMINETCDLSYIIVDSEQDALILENSLIKQLKPKYNILLRDDKTYPYIYVDLEEDFPRFDITRKIVSGKNIKYFGPFATGGRDLLDSLYEIFPLVQKKNCIKGKKACLFYQIKKCLAPCENLVTSDEYKKIVFEVIKYINNKEKIIQELSKKMVIYSENLNFEEAGSLRDKINSIKNSSIISGVDFANDDDFDVISINYLDDRACSVRLFIRGGKVVSSSHNFFRFSQGFDLDEGYERTFLSIYHKDMPITSTKIYLYDSFSQQKEIKTWLDATFNKNFEISIPKIGAKRKITQLAYKNAMELLKIKDDKKDLFINIKDLLDLKELPYRIEVFDNSHNQGSATVGAMIVYNENSFEKESYRHYNLESKDEYSQMREVLIKRVESFEKNPPPNLWLIDGGETLRKLAVDILKSVGVSIDIVAIAKEKIDAKAHRAKGSSKDILYSEEKVLKLDPSDKRLQFLQRLRDEAHRFAISYHRKIKQKEDLQISLLNISGIGEAKIKRLVDYFGTFEEIKKATLEELELVLNKKDGKNLFEYFKSN